MTTELEETMYIAFKHEFEAFLSHQFDYDELMARFNFRSELVDKFTERYWDEEVKTGRLLERIKDAINAYFESKGV